MFEPLLDVAVVGAGPAGLAVSFLLRESGVRHRVFERNRIGDTWRSQRWDSFMLNSPNKFNILPGDDSAGTNPDGFDSGQSFVSYLEGYAKRHHLPVLEHARVVSVERNSSVYHVTALVHSTLRTYACRQVVVASGAMNEPRIPSFARNISPRISQYHAGEYRSPSELPDGAVLVVGTAQSGLQIAEDILETGRKVYLSTSAVGRVPRRYRGRDILEWLLSIGFYDVKTEEVTDPRDFEVRQPQVSGVGPRGHTLSLQSLARQGAVIVGKINSTNVSRLALQPNAADHVRFSDAVSRRIKALIDQHVTKNHLDAPPPESDPADEPDADAACATPLRSLDLERADVRSIVWATGFTGDYSYLKVPATDVNGRPVHRNGISNLRGIYYVGFPWLRKRKSGIINGIAEDAAFVAEKVTLASAS